jgi:hypothetical protein
MYNLDALCGNPSIIALTFSKRFAMFSALELNKRIHKKIDGVLKLIVDMLRLNAL